METNIENTNKPIILLDMVLFLLLDVVLDELVLSTLLETVSLGSVVRDSSDSVIGTLILSELEKSVLF